MSETINNRYRLLDKIGQGGMGTVYHAQDRLTSQMVALKRVAILPNHLQFGSHSNANEIDSTRLALATEFRTLASLRHPHIVSVLDYGFDVNLNNEPYYTMQYLEGGQRLTDYSEMRDTAEKLRLLYETLQALAYLHRRGIIHRDLKPDNVLVTMDGVVKVMDFGLALHQAQSITNLYPGVVGTLAYMAPELFAEEPATVQSDLYAVGVIMYELFMQQHPFNRNNIALMLNNILNSVPDTTTLDEELAQVVQRLLAKRPDDRYESADAVLKALYTATQQQPGDDTALRERFLQAAQFVGRQTEWAQLKLALQNTRQGTSSTWLVAGESGVGKSRLLDELRTRALVDGMLVLRGQAAEGGGLPYHLWRDVARRLVLSTELDDFQAAILKEIVPDIGTLLERDIPDAPPLDGTAGQQRLAQTITNMFRAQTQPILLLLEDLQWTGESLTPLKQLNLLLGQLVIVIVGSYRDDERPDLPNELPEMQLLKLRRFDDATISQLSASMLGEMGQEPEIVDLLKRETEGNAFFMVEVVRALAKDAGRLADVGRITLKQPIEAGGVQQVIRRRLSRVPSLIQNWLKGAAVFGRNLDLAIMKELTLELVDNFIPEITVPTYTTHTEKPTLNSISSLNQEQMLMWCANAAVLEFTDGHWRFAHDKIREFILFDLSTEEHQKLHRQVAEAIEKVYADNDSFSEILADHWYIAGDNSKTIDTTLKAAERLVYIIADYARAQQLVERALPLVGTMRQIQTEGMILLTLLGDSLAKRGEYSSANARYKEALAASVNNSSSQIVAQALNGLSWTAWALGDYILANQYAQQAWVVANGIADQKGMAVCLSNLGIISRSNGLFEEAKGYLEQSLDIQRKINNRQGIAACLNNLGRNFLSHEMYDTAQDYFTQSLDIRREISDRQGIGACLNNLGLIYLSRNEYNTA